MSWEVLTMRSAKSFFNPTIARSDLRHYWPVLFGYVGIWTLLLPMQVWSSRRTTDVIAESSSLYQFGDDALLRLCINNYAPAIIMALCFGVGMVMLVFSYMMNTRSTGAMHALPIRRGGLFATHFLTGFAMLVAGNLFIALLTWLAAVAVGMPLSPALLTWLVMVTVLELFFMALATLCAVLTGWLLAVPVLYAAANGGVIALTMLGRTIATLLLRGYSFESDITSPVRWLTPLYQMFHGLCQSVYSSWRYELTNDQVPSGLTATGWQTLLWYGLAALVLLALSYFLYTRRKSELSGDAVAFRWLRPVFRLGLGLAGGLASGLLLYYIVVLYTGNESNPLSRLCVCLVLMGAICYFAAAMLVNKSLKVFRRGWKGAVLTAAVLVLLCVGIKADLFGYSRWLPAQDEILEVRAQVGMCDLDYDDDPAAVEAVLRLHEAILDADEQEHDNMDMRYFNVSYRLRDGRTVSRQYDFDLNGPANGAMRNFVALPKVQLSFLLGGSKDITDATRFLSGYVYLYGAKEGTEDIDLELELTAQQAQALYQAALSDAENGRVLQDPNGYTYVTDIQIELYGEECYCGIYNLTTTCTDTLAVLEELGIPAQLLVPSE